MPHNQPPLYLRLRGSQLRGGTPLPADGEVDVEATQLHPARDGWCRLAGTLYTDQDPAGWPLRDAEVRADALPPDAQAGGLQ